MSRNDRTAQTIIDDSLAAPGFLKTSRTAGPAISGQQRAVLIRRGNELFNGGKLDEAKRVFVTTGYSDGLVRLGDHYYKNGQPLEAFRMYWLAPDRPKADRMIEKMAGVIRGWLKEEDNA